MSIVIVLIEEKTITLNTLLMKHRYQLQQRSKKNPIMWNNRYRFKYYYKNEMKPNKNDGKKIAN